MSSVSKDQKTTFWQANFRDSENKRINRSTGIPNTFQNRGIAEKISQLWEGIAKRSHSKENLEMSMEMLESEITHKLKVDSDSLTLDRLRKKTDSLFRKYFVVREIPSFRNVSEKWLSDQKLRVKQVSLTSYTQGISEFIEHLGSNADLPLDQFDWEWILTFQQSQASKVSNRTTNKKVKHVCAALRWAYRKGIIDVDHTGRIEHLKTEKVQKRRPFTVKELKKILSVANAEWQSMIYAGYGTGQRLGDIAMMRWEDLDLNSGIWNLTTNKTGRQNSIPLLSDVWEILKGTPKSKRIGYVHPKAAQLYQSQTTGGFHSAALSNQFAMLLYRAGLRETKPTHRKKKKGRDTEREPVGLGFHCLRYTTATMLNESRTPQAIAKEVLGHSSEVVHFRIRQTKDRANPRRNRKTFTFFTLTLEDVIGIPNYFHDP